MSRIKEQSRGDINGRGTEHCKHEPESLRWTRYQKEDEVDNLKTWENIEGQEIIPEGT